MGFESGALTASLSVPRAGLDYGLRGQGEFQWYFAVLPVLFVLLVHLRRADVHGHLGVLPTHTQTPLGRVPEQVLQGHRLQVRALLF